MSIWSDVYTVRAAENVTCPSVLQQKEVNRLGTEFNYLAVIPFEWMNLIMFSGKNELWSRLVPPFLYQADTGGFRFCCAHIWQLTFWMRGLLRPQSLCNTIVVLLYLYLLHVLLCFHTTAAKSALQFSTIKSYCTQMTKAVGVFMDLWCCSGTSFWFESWTIWGTDPLMFQCLVVLWASISVQWQYMCVLPSLPFQNIHFRFCCWSPAWCHKPVLNPFLL